MLWLPGTWGQSKLASCRRATSCHTRLLVLRFEERRRSRKGLHQQSGTLLLQLLPLLLLPVAVGGLFGAGLFRVIAALPWPARASWRDVLYGWFGFLVLLMMIGSGALQGFFTGVEVEIILITLVLTLGFAWSVWVHQRAAPPDLPPANPGDFD